MPMSDLHDHDEPTAWERHTLQTLGDGSIQGVVETNDNLDRGYPSEHASWEVAFRNRAHLDERKCWSRTGVIGVKVTVTLDGQELHGPDVPISAPGRAETTREAPRP